MFKLLRQFQKHPYYSLNYLKHMKFPAVPLPFFRTSLDLKKNQTNQTLLFHILTSKHAFAEIIQKYSHTKNP